MAKQTILIIEDERALVEVLTYNLRKEGFDVHSATDLLPDSARASGFNSVEALLDGKREFIAVGLSGGGSLLVNRGSIRTVATARPALPFG